MSVVFVFSASLNDVTPLSRIVLSVVVMKNERKRIVDGCHLCVFFPLSSQVRLSSVSVVFNLNASLNNVAPVPPILLSVYVMRKEKRVNC